MSPVEWAVRNALAAPVVLVGVVAHEVAGWILGAEPDVPGRDPDDDYTTPEEFLAGLRWDIHDEDESCDYGDCGRCWVEFTDAGDT